jgi:hypothetical protein
MAEDRMRTIEEVVAQAGRVFDAGLAATDALFGIPGPTGETTPHHRAPAC